MTDTPNQFQGNPDFCEGNQTIEVRGVTLPTFAGVIWPAWRAAAKEKGYDIVARVKDRIHLVLRCHSCGALTVVKLFVFMNNKPRCKGCLLDQKLSGAEAAGLTFLRRDPTDRKNAFYLAACGHELKRQFGFITRIGAGEVAARCEICHLDKERTEARVHDWVLLGPDVAGDPNYRIYRHLTDACNHVQRIARSNLHFGRFSCNECGGTWPSEPSYLYLMRFEMPDRGHVLKLGFFNNPIGRLTFQLRLRNNLGAELLREVPMSTGHAAICVEKKFHTHLKTNWPEQVMSPVGAPGRHPIRDHVRPRTRQCQHLPGLYRRSRAAPVGRAGSVPIGIYGLVMCPTLVFTWDTTTVRT